MQYSTIQLLVFFNITNKRVKCVAIINGIGLVYKNNVNL